MFPLSLYLSFFVDYFSTNFILLGLVLAVSLIVVFFVAFKRGKSAQVRSKYLISMSVISSSVWVYVLSSLALCMLMVQNYWEDPVSAIMLVSKLALGVTFCLGIASVFVFQRRALHRAFESITSQSHPLVTIAESSTTTTMGNTSLSQILSKLNKKEGSAAVSVQAVTIKSTSSLPDSLAFDSRKLKLIGVKEDVPLLLDEDELEAVLAHELGHIVHKDAFQKSLATAYKVAFPFDLLARLVEAALYRERELDADDFSARITRKPLALASALLKMYERGSTLGSSSPNNNISQVSLLMNSSAEKKLPRMSLFSKEPALAMRIERLIAIEKA